MKPDRSTRPVMKRENSLTANTARHGAIRPGIEFYPMADENLHIFLTGTARSYRLTEKAKALGASIENTQRLSVGFIYKLPLY